MSNERTLILKLDDSDVKRAIERMQTAGFGSKIGGSKQSGGSDVVGQIFGKNSSIFKNLAKLTLISAAIAAVLKLVQKISSAIVGSSPILQTMLKLFQTSITFILRPIGDFIGFFLRPLLIVFLRQIALPIYRTWGPIMKSLGIWLGGGFATELKSILGPREARAEQLRSDITEKQRSNAEAITNFFAEIKASILGFTITMPDFSKIDLGAFNVNFGKYFDAVGLRIKTGFQPFLDNFDNNILLPLSNMNISFQGLSNFTNNIMLGMSNAFDSILPKFTEFSVFVGSIVEQARAPIDEVISTISGFFASISEFFKNLIDSINGLILQVPEMLGNIVGSGVAGATTITQNFFEGAIQQGQGIVDDIFEGFEGVAKSINSTLSGRE